MQGECICLGIEMASFLFEGHRAMSEASSAAHSSIFEDCLETVSKSKKLRAMR